MPAETSLFSDDNCVICYDDMNMPVVIPCRHVFCFDCIVTWASTSNRCPSCRQDIEFRRARSRWLKYVAPTSLPESSSSTEPKLSSAELVGENDKSRPDCAQSSDESLVGRAGVEPSSQEDASSTVSIVGRVRVQSAKLDWIVEYCATHPSESVIVYSNGASSFISS